MHEATPTPISHWSRIAPGLPALVRHRRADFAHDLIAGFSVAAVALPVGGAYAQLGGFNPVHGWCANNPTLGAVARASARRRMGGRTAPQAVRAYQALGTPANTADDAPGGTPRTLWDHLDPTLRGCLARATRWKFLGGLGVWCACLMWASTALGQPAENPLKPADRSSPRAALQTFLTQTDALCEFLAKDYLPSPSRRGFARLQEAVRDIVPGLDLSEVPLAARRKQGSGAARKLYMTLRRIPLPPWDEIPDGATNLTVVGDGVLRWVIPNTEIALEANTSGRQAGQFLFSTDTVARANEFYQKTRGLPCTQPVPLADLEEAITLGGGWMVPKSYVDWLPAWLRQPVAEQVLWKWAALLFLLLIWVLLLKVVHRLVRSHPPPHPFLQALADLVVPAVILTTTPLLTNLVLFQINLQSKAGSAVEVIWTFTMFVVGAWTIWRIAPVLAEAVIASPHIPTQSIDAHLIRISLRLLGLIGAATLLSLGADRLGVPVYGIVAGLGVGGIAIALAAQPTIENLIGGLSLFADQPVVVGDFCKYGDDMGTVEAIGIRSTRIRGVDRTLTTIPNAALSKMPLVNLTHRDRMLLKTTLGLRYETRPDQLRHVLAKLRELLLAHPMVTPEPARVRFAGFGDSALNVEVFAYVGTTDWNEFLAVQEDLCLRMMDIVEASGTGIAFPSQTLYFARDQGLDRDRSEAAQREVERWRAEHKLPFPEFDLEFRQTHRDTLDYPPADSAAAKPKEGA